MISDFYLKWLLEKSPKDTVNSYLKLNEFKMDKKYKFLDIMYMHTLTNNIPGKRKHNLF